MIETGKEDGVVLRRVPYVYYPIWFKKKEVQALIDSGNEVNVILPTYALRLSLRVHHTDVKTQKIDGFTFEIFGIVLASFQVEDKLEKTRFFQETFLLADISMEVVLGMPFLTFSNADV